MQVTLGHKARLSHCGCVWDCSALNLQASEQGIKELLKEIISCISKGSKTYTSCMGMYPMSVTQWWSCLSFKWGALVRGEFSWYMTPTSLYAQPSSSHHPFSTSALLNLIHKGEIWGVPYSEFSKTLFFTVPQSRSLLEIKGQFNHPLVSLLLRLSRQRWFIESCHGSCYVSDVFGKALP